MKDASIGDYLLWEGKPAKVIGSASPTIIIELLEDAKCPHCNESIGKEHLYVIVSSPQFQNGASRMQTIRDDDK